MDKDILAQLGAFAEQWSRAGYPFLSEDQRKLPEKYFSQLYAEFRAGDKQAQENVKLLEAKFLKPELTDFDLKEHFLRLLREQVGVDKRGMSLFEEKMRTSDIYAMVPMERFCSETKLVRLCDKEQAYQYREQSEKVLKRLLEARGLPNERMAEMLKDNPPVFCFEESDECDAGMSGIFLRGRNRPLMTLLSGLMERGKNDEDFLAVTMAHELGHWLDFGNRPENYFGKEKLWQECFADVAGCAVAINAGYGVQKMVEERKKFAALYRQNMMNKGKKLPQKTMFEERAELLEKMFGACGNSQVLQYKRVADRGR